MDEFEKEFLKQTGEIVYELEDYAVLKRAVESINYSISVSNELGIDKIISPEQDKFIYDCLHMIRCMLEGKLDERKTNIVNMLDDLGE